MAQEALQMLNSRAQLTRSQMSIKKSRTPIRQKSRKNLALNQQRKSRTQLNMMPAQETFRNMQMVPERPDYAKTSILEKSLLEAANKERLAQERQRVRSQMQSFKLPQMMPEVPMYDSQAQEMQDAFEQEYLQQIQTQEFQQAAMQKIEAGVNQEQSRVHQKQLKRAQQRATQSATESMQQVAQAAKATASAGKLGWDTENILCLVDAVEPADLEIPTIINVFIQGYRGLTAILNNGQKFLKGPLAFLEPEPLYRFWSPEAAGKLISAGTSDIFGGGTEIENTIESMTIGWPQAIIGIPAVIFLVLTLISILFFIFLILMIGAAALGAL